MESRADFREREGLILSQCRLESGLSQEYVARQMDVNIRTVRNWEEGLSPIRNDDLLMWFTVCKQSPWRWLQRIWMPSAFSDTNTPNWTDEHVDKALSDYIEQMPSLYKRRLLYILCGAHGSDWAGQIDLLCANAHTSMQSRVRVCQAVIQNYRIDTATGADPCPESTKPDFDACKYACKPERLPLWQATANITQGKNKKSPAGGATPARDKGPST